jgi:hypothetical protein
MTGSNEGVTVDSKKAGGDTVQLPSDDSDTQIVDISGGRFPLVAKRKIKAASLSNGSGTGLCGTASTLYIHDNRFSLLPGIGRLRSLRVLKLFANDIRLLPEEAGQLTELQQLSVKTSEQGVSILPDLAGLKALRVLNLHHAPLKQSNLPHHIGELSALKRLAVTHYAITSIPPEISHLTNLEELDLSFNRISSIPPEVGKLVALRVLLIGSNKIASLPVELEHLVSLVTLDLSYNKLMELKPVDLSKLASLTSLHLQVSWQFFESQADILCLKSWSLWIFYVVGCIEYAVLASYLTLLVQGGVVSLDTHVENLCQSSCILNSGTSSVFCSSTSCKEMSQYLPGLTATWRETSS